MAVSTVITPIYTHNVSNSHDNLTKSHSKLHQSNTNLFINDLNLLTNSLTCQNFTDLTPNPLINTDTNFYNNQNLRINKVGSYVELRLKRLSASKCLSNDLDQETKSFRGLGYSRSYYNEQSRRHSTASTESFSSNYKSERSRSPSISSSSYSFYSPFAQDHSFRIKKPKKLKLALAKKMPGLNTTSQTAPNISALSKKLNTKKSQKTSKNKQQQQRTKAQKKTTKKVPGGSKHNKFLKLTEDYQLSRHFLSQSSCGGMTGSLSNFSVANVNSNSGGGSFGGGVGVGGRKLKCLLVGDARVGKSALMWLYLKRNFEYEYQPTVVDDYEVKIVLNGESYTLSLFDTAGQEDWETLRVMAYPDTDVILLCYSVVRPDSMENIKTKWMPELNKYLPDALIVLVGTQVDLRESSMTSSATDPRSRHITTREGEELKQKIGAFRYIECSALTQLNIKEVFDSCIEAYAKSNPPIQPSCFETLFKRFTKTIRSRFNIRLHSSNSTSSSNNSKNSTKLAKYSNKEAKYLHEQ